MAVVFITREVAADHPQRLRLEALGHTLVGSSMLTFEPVPAEIPGAVDWVFAYSRQAVKAIAAQGVLAEAFRQNPRLRLAGIGAGTASAWRSSGFDVAFEGTGSPEAVAEAFAVLAQGQRIAFLQAAESRRSIERLLGERVRAVPVVCYRAEPSQARLPNPVDVLCLTSPRSAELALAQLPPRANVTIYCIGGPTAEAVKAMGFDVNGVAEAPGIEALLSLV